MPEERKSPPVAPRIRPRMPSGPRAQRDSASSFRSISSSTVPLSSISSSASTPKPPLRNQSSLTSIGRLRELNDSPLDALIDAEHEFTLSPETSPQLVSTSPPPSTSTSVPPARVTSPPKSPIRAKTFGIVSGRTEEESSRSQTLPQRPITPTAPSPFVVSRPSSSSQATSPPPNKIRPKPSKLNTFNLLSPNSSPTKPVSPGVKHWQQVRAHVLAPTPAEERPVHKTARKLNLVSKAAGRFGFRHAAENVLGYEERRRSTLGFVPDMGGLSLEEQEEVARERRKFARDVKACLDACALEETRRRLQRGDYNANDPKLASLSTHKQAAGSVYSAQLLSAQRYNFDPDFSSFAPLLMELHRHLPAARAKRLWSRTCPHHAAILSELGVSFLSDGASTNGERQQALEVFGVVVRNWASDSADEELDRWLWLCKALLLPDKQLRNRGLPLLASFLHVDPELPPAHDRPHTATAFQALVMALLRLVHSLERAGSGFEEHHEAVVTLLAEVVEGEILDIEVGSLKELISGDADELVQATGGLEKELLWLAVGRCLSSGAELATWLIALEGEVLSRYAPSPLLHATPPVILRLRALSTNVMLASLSEVARNTIDSTTLQQVWQVAERYILPECQHLPDADGSIGKSIGTLLLTLELVVHSLAPKMDSEFDPFRISTTLTGSGVPVRHQDVLVEMLRSESGKVGMYEAAKDVVMQGPLEPVTRTIRFCLQSKAFTGLGRDMISAFFDRLALGTTDLSASQHFLRYLQSSHPQLFYKPLFSLSACTSSANLTSHLRLVRALAESVGPAHFWTSADPQMVVIILMGQATPKADKGKGREGEVAKVNVKLGRYACLVELLLALREIEHGRGKEKGLRSFIDTVESRLGVMLEAEEKLGTLPSWYRALLCRLFYTFRAITLSIRKTSWQRLIIHWLTSARPADAKDASAAILRATYVMLHSSSDHTERPPHSNNPTRRDTVGPVAVKEDEDLRLSLSTTAASLLVAIHACLSKDDWTVLLPHLWFLAEPNVNAPHIMKPVAFLLMKCGEVVPDAWHDYVLSELYSANALTRSSALRKIALLYGWRYQVLSQLILTDRRGPVFHFPARTLEFVATEIGSPFWVPPHDVQDAALKKFGTILPLELRQRLMELGWSEEETIAGKSDWEQIPVSSLPTLQLQENATDEPSAPSSPMRSLMRRGSSASGSSFHGKRRKAIFAPILLALVSEQAAALSHDPDSQVGVGSRELLRLLQRDDPANFLRPFSDGLSIDFRRSLSGLNAVVIVATPSFAYSALNVITGYLKTVLRNDATFGSYAPALATVSKLVPHVSEMSLRDIRKHKAEHVLLPASIHEEEGGYKLHAPWRDGLVDVQTAQLLILNEILKVNPREVYLFKKMLSNLQIHASIPNRSFARAWLVLIVTLFSTVNRNYNDRAELRHFLSNVAAILRLYGTTDLLIVSHALRVVILCSARFRRLFASMGFSTVLHAVYELYASAADNSAVRDCVEYASRSFYRIHQDAYVYQACVVIAEGAFDAKAAYDFFAALSVTNASSSGVASGMRGLNDKEEIEALVQLLSGPELTFAEIGTDAAERQASKMATVNLEGSPFPKENIIRLLVTVIAAHPATTRAASFLGFFAGIIPHVKDAASLDLVREGVEALGSVILKGRVGDDAARLMFHGGEEHTRSDWDGARKEYVLLVESFARSGGRLSSAGTKRTLEMVYDLLRKQPEKVGPAAASILRELAKTHLHASGSRPMVFLRDIAPLFRVFIAVVDFSGLLEEINSLIKRAGYDLDVDTTQVIVESYVEPAVRLLAGSSEDNMAFILPLRNVTVELLASAVFLRGDALGTLERFPPNPTLLASLVIPLGLALQQPTEVEREVVMDAIWIRLLRYVITLPKATRGKTAARNSAQSITSTAVLSVQMVKLITLRARDSISRTPGLWHYISNYLSSLINGGNGHFMDGPAIAPRLVDCMMWSVFELLALRSSPLMIDMRHLIQIVLAVMESEASSSAPSTPGEGRFSLSSNVGPRSRMPSARSPSVFIRNPSSSPIAPAPPLPGEHSRQASATHLTPDSAVIGGADGHSRMPSQSLSPALGHGRMPSGSFAVGAGPRPSFADLSARRASRPAFTVPGGSQMAYRFPSSQPVRQLGAPTMPGSKGGGGGGGGAIIHLLGAPNNVLGATSAAMPILGISAGAEELARVLRDTRVASFKLRERARRSVRACKVAFGLGGEEDEDVRVWTTTEAINVVAEETRLWVEDEFKDIFASRTRPGSAWESDRGDRTETQEKGYSMDQIRSYDYDDKGTTDDVFADGGYLEEEEIVLPKLEITGVR